MHLVLARYLNKRLIELHPRVVEGSTIKRTSRGETVGVLRRDGSYDYRTWLGFIDRVEARKLGKPVKLQVARVGYQDEVHIDWRDVAKGRHVQGCLTPDGAYAVADWTVRVV